MIILRATHLEGASHVSNETFIIRREDEQTSAWNRGRLGREKVGRRVSFNDYHFPFSVVAPGTFWDF